MAVRVNWEVRGEISKAMQVVGPDGCTDRLENKRAELGEVLEAVGRVFGEWRAPPSTGGGGDKSRPEGE